MRGRGGVRADHFPDDQQWDLREWHEAVSGKV